MKNKKPMRIIKEQKNEGKFTKKEIKESIEIVSILKPLDELIIEVEYHTDDGVQCLKDVRQKIANNIRSKLQGKGLK